MTALQDSNTYKVKKKSYLLCQNTKWILPSTGQQNDITNQLNQKQIIKVSYISCFSFSPF